MTETSTVPSSTRDRRAARVERVDVRLRARRQRHLGAVREPQRQRARRRTDQAIAHRPGSPDSADSAETEYDSG